MQQEWGWARASDPFIQSSHKIIGSASEGPRLKLKLLNTWFDPSGCTVPMGYLLHPPTTHTHTHTPLQCGQSCR